MCKFRECIYVHAPIVLEDEYLKTGKMEERLVAGRVTVARACRRCGTGALIDISRLGSTFCAKTLLGAIQSVHSISQGM